MNTLLAWAVAQPQGEPFKSNLWTRVINAETSPPVFWKSPMSGKILGAQFPTNFGPGMELDINHSTSLGGMCLLTTIDMKAIFRQQIKFDSVKAFEKWFRGWYPRIDQVHDTVGVPPVFCRKILYVIEDSFFAGRLSSYTGLDRKSIQSVLKKVHQEQGHTVLCNYLRCLGYKGDVAVIYTSDIDRELSVALKIWERQLGFSFRTCDRDFAKVELMYTGFWLDILDISSSGIIHEAASKMIMKGWLRLESWVHTQKYGTGANRNLAIACYLPFLTSKGDCGFLSFDEVPNYGNFATFKIPENEIHWYTANLLFIKKAVIESGPSSIAQDKVVELIAADLKQYYKK